MGRFCSRDLHRTPQCERHSTAPSAMYAYTDFDRQFVRARAAVRHPAGTSPARRTGGRRLPLRLQNGWYVSATRRCFAWPCPTERSAPASCDNWLASRAYDRGFGHFTTRQNLQFNWIPLDEAADVMDLLADVDMHGIRPAATASATSPATRWPVWRPTRRSIRARTAEILRQWSTLHPEFAFLPRKFRSPSPAPPRIAPRRAGTTSACTCTAMRRATWAFACWWGRHGPRPVIGSVIAEFVPWQQILVYIEAVLRSQPLRPARQHVQGAHQDPGQGRGPALLRRGGRRVSPDPERRRRLGII